MNQTSTHAELPTLRVAIHASSANPGPSGWAYYLGPQHFGSGFLPDSTGNRAHLTAVEELLRTSNAWGPHQLEVLTTSTYVKKMVTRLKSFRVAGWPAAGDLPNAPVLQRIDAELGPRQVRVVHVAKAERDHLVVTATALSARALSDALRRVSA